MFHVKHRKEKNDKMKSIFLIVGIFILLDILTGLLSAFKNKEFNSTVMKEGAYHKAGSILLVVFGLTVDYAQSFIDLGATIPMAKAFSIYIITMEFGSIIENIGRLW